MGLSAPLALALPSALLLWLAAAEALCVGCMDTLPEARGAWLSVTVRDTAGVGVGVKLLALPLLRLPVEEALVARLVVAVAVGKVCVAQGVGEEAGEGLPEGVAGALPLPLAARPPALAVG